MFSFEFLNSPFEDTVLYCTRSNSKKHLLFDMGTLHRMSIAKILKINWVFISHAHVDHFFGFHYYLRSLLTLGKKEVNFFGPEGIISNMTGALSSYKWNLLKDYKLVFNVMEISANGITTAKISSKNLFKAEIIEKKDFNTLILDEKQFKVECEILDHLTPVLAFRLSEKDKLSVDKKNLVDRGLKPGKWLRLAKELILSGDISDKRIEYEDGKYLALKEIKTELFKLNKYPAYAYLTDFAFNDANLEKLLRLSCGVEKLFIECQFLKEDENLARQTAHLCSEDVAKIVLKSEAKSYQLMHLSQRYLGRKTEKDFYEEIDGFLNAMN